MNIDADPHRDDCDDAETALLYEIYRRGNQCLSTASMYSGFGIPELQRALDQLLKRGLVRERPGQDRLPEFRSYEPNL